MILNSDGKLGIGTSSPDELLEIMNGTLKITREETEDSVVTEDTVTLNIAGGLKWTFSKSVDDPNPVPIGTTTDNDIRIMRNNQTHLQFYWNKTYLTKDVGIGTSDPNQKLTVEGSMSLKEQASANTDTAAYGQLWVKTATPNELYFTTDAGDDIQLTSGTSAAGGGGGSGAVSAVANGSNNRIATFSSSDALNGEANLTFDGTTLAVTASGTSTTLLLESTDAGAADAPILELYRNSSSPANTDDLGQILWSGEKSDGSKYSITKMYGQINTLDNSDRLMINIASSGGSGLNNYEYMRFDGGVRDIIINEEGRDIDFRIEGDSDSSLFFTDASSDRIGIGTTSPDAKLHVSSGTDLDCGIIIEADTDNNDEDDLPFLWFKQDGDITVHAIQATSNRLQIINNISASGGIDFALGTTNNTGTTDPSTGTTTALSIESDGGVQARKTVIKAVSSNTTLADADSGKTIYWTGGTLTLPATAQSGQQFVVINNTNASATPGLGTSNAIATNWTSHAAMADETARTYIAVAANTWIYIG